LLGACGFSKQATPDLSTADLSGVDFSGADLSGATSCRTLPLPCLPPAGNVYNVSSSADVQTAFAGAKSGDTIQIVGLSLGAGFRVPSGVTLHGCMGAQITDTIAFAGLLGTIKGFVVPGAIIANATGTYVVRANRFVGGGSTTYAGVNGLANQGIGNADVTLTVEGNWFSLRDYGVQALTAYDTGVHDVNLTVRNNIFYGDGKAGVSIDQSGLAGHINVAIAFNDFVSCGHGVELTTVTPTTPLFADIFYLGGVAVVSDSPYTVMNVDYYGDLATMGALPMGGSFQNADPLFADWANNDLHLKPGSPLIDAVPIGTSDVPIDDYFGCPRPVGNGADVGAIENQQ
jgi:hypothetical protein